MTDLKFPEKYPEILSDLAGLVHRRLIEQGIGADLATKTALDLAEDVRLKWGGGLIYIPKGDGFARGCRDAEIWREFNGRNHAELARKHGLTLSCVYDIIARERNRRQAGLFER
ncbi:MAG: Mor transcription activator family protein [Candidatus Competibacteraceae bacterium]